MNQVAALLLAAGRSRRMGAFKPLLPFGNRTVVDACIDSLRRAEVNDIVVVVGHRANELQKHLESSKTRFAINPDADSEMSASIARGVEQLVANAGAVIIALVDHPAVAPEAIGSLIDEWKRGAKLVQPEYQGRGGHPVLIDFAYRSELLCLNPRTGLRSLFDAHRHEVRRLPVESPYVARDMDTWEDYLSLHGEVFGALPAANSPRFS
ncbi:MAG: NTP transferase domain-containing protein [Pyrinomonadaceae bacterium]